jgi:hypothetical protein
VPEFWVIFDSHTFVEILNSTNIILKHVAKRAEHRRPAHDFRYIIDYYNVMSEVRVWAIIIIFCVGGPIMAVFWLGIAFAEFIVDLFIFYVELYIKVSESNK